MIVAVDGPAGSGKGTVTKKGEITITFKEGINMRKVASLIEEKTSNTKDDVLSLVNDDTYIDSLIEKYWFLDSSIKDSSIYYPLEGYLYPETYIFASKDVKIEDIFTKMLDETDKRLSNYKDEIESSRYSLHEIMTLASIVELEGAKATDRSKVAGVFYNRLDHNMTLGSDVTTYYAEKIDDFSKSLSGDELNNCNNKYNTRCPSYLGLPIGPICNPSEESIKATIEPTKEDYFYFVADCKGEVYLSKNSTEHSNIINKLKREDNWCA